MWCARDVFSDVGIDYSQVASHFLPTSLRPDLRCILDNDLVLIPVNVNANHWVCVSLAMRCHEISYLDSLDLTEVCVRPR